MVLFDGKYHANLLEQKIQDFLETNPNKHFGKLVILQVGENASSEKYVALKISLCQRLGIGAKLIEIDPSLADEKIFEQIETVFKDKDVRGGIIQLPLPRASLNKALELIPEDKDIDLLSPTSQKKFYSYTREDILQTNKLPPVVRAVDYFLKTSKLNIENKKVAIIGAGFLVGQPLSYYFEKFGANISIINHYENQNIAGSQLIVLSAGVSNLVNGEALSSDAFVIDFGSSVVNGKTIGDLNLNSKLDHLNIVAPSPGGMGPLVVRFLIMNFLGI